MDTRLLNKRVLESLIRAGAMDGLGAHRAQMMAVIDRAMERAQKLQRARESGQHGLFGGGSAAAVALPPPKFCRKSTNGRSTSCSLRNIPRWAFTFPAIRSINTPAA